MSKQGQFALYWLEYVAGAVLVISFYVAARSAYVGAVYLTAFLIGALLGKFWYDQVRRRRTLLYISIFTLAVLLGMLLGSFGSDRRFVVILFGIGLGLSYVAHAEKWIRSW